jgi:hypothetical protein
MRGAEEKQRRDRGDQPDEAQVFRFWVPILDTRPPWHGEKPLPGPSGPIRLTEERTLQTYFDRRASFLR